MKEAWDFKTPNLTNVILSTICESDSPGLNLGILLFNICMTFNKNKGENYALKKKSLFTLYTTTILVESKSFKSLRPILGIFASVYTLTCLFRFWKKKCTHLNTTKTKSNGKVWIIYTSTIQVPQLPPPPQFITFPCWTWKRLSKAIKYLCSTI